MPYVEGARERPWFRNTEIMTKGKAVLYTGLNSPFVLQEAEVFRISRQSPHESVKVIGPAQRPL
jgi:hypothetical protein